MIAAKKNAFEEAAVQLGCTGRLLLERVPRRVQEKTLEIRLRAGRSAVVETIEGRYEISGLHSCATDIDDCIQNLCRFSLHSFEKELREGFMTLKGGHRAGFCGKAVIKNGELSIISEISSMNIRIASQIYGCASVLEDTVLEDGFRGMLIVGPPMSGKTTILRDLCRAVGDRRKVSLVDSRNEVAAVYGRIPQNDVGINTDVLSGYQKNDGIVTAVRVMSPEFVFCDEITGEEKSVSECVGCGVKPVFTAHSGSIDEVMDKLPFVGAFSHIARLGDGGRLGKIMELREIKKRSERKAI